jgi:cobalt-zinc-cadmium resistance protein CzcA
VLASVASTLVAIADNMEEAVSGVKGELAVKPYGTDLRTLESTAQKIINVMRSIRSVQDLGLFRVIGRPNLNFRVNREGLTDRTFISVTMTYS